MKHFEKATVADEESILSQEVAPVDRDESEAGHNETVQNLVEKGLAKDTQEARGIVEKLGEILRTSEEIRQNLDDFESDLLRIISDAETHLADLEKDMKESFEDRGEVFRQIAEQLAVNFDDVKQREKSGPYKPNLARRFANFVLRNKAALVAVTVFTAVLRLGGGAAHASEAHSYAGDHFSDGYHPYDEGPDTLEMDHDGSDTSDIHSAEAYPYAGDHSSDEHEGTDTLAMDHDGSDAKNIHSEGRSEHEHGGISGYVELFNDLHTHESDESGEQQADSIHSHIEHLRNEINNGTEDAGAIVVNLENGDATGSIDAHHLQERIHTDGSIRLSVHSFASENITEQDGNAEEHFEGSFSVSVEPSHEGGENHDQNASADVKMNDEGHTPEEAVLNALHNLSDYLGVSVTHEASSEYEERGANSSENAMSHTVTASEHVINVSSIEVIAHETDDDNDGHTEVSYTATVVGHEM